MEPRGKRVRVAVPRLAGHVIEFGMDGHVVLYGPDHIYLAEAKEGFTPADCAQEMVRAVAEDKVPEWMVVR